MVIGITDPSMAREYYKNKEAELNYNKDGIKIVEVFTFRAAKYFASGSRGRNKPWCISSNEDDWDNYDRKGYDWIFLLVKNDTEKYALDKKLGLVWDENNHGISFHALEADYPIIFEISLMI